MKTRFILCACIVAGLSACASAPDSGDSSANVGAITLTIDQTSTPHQVREAVPSGALLDGFEVMDANGRLVSYLAFADTKVAGVLFVDDKLQAVLPRRTVQAYLICRGYVLATRNYWARDAADWMAGLVAKSEPATSVTVEFSGKSATQSLKEASDSPFLGKIRMLLGLGSNPFGLISTLSSARSDFEASEQFAKEVKGMAAIKPGMSEKALADVAKPEYFSFVPGGMVLVYPAHHVEYFIADGVVKLIQYPSLYAVSGSRAALFYEPGMQWLLCNSEHWTDAFGGK